MLLKLVSQPGLAARLWRAFPVQWATAGGFLVALFFVVDIHGFLPDESQPMLQTILDAGTIQCLHDQGWGALAANCDALGAPLGLTIPTGLPETELGWPLSWLPGIDAWAAHQLLNVLLDAVALTGGYLLLRRWDVVCGIARYFPVSPTQAALFWPQPVDQTHAELRDRAHAMAKDPRFDATSSESMTVLRLHH